MFYRAMSEKHAPDQRCTIRILGRQNKHAQCMPQLEAAVFTQTANPQQDTWLTLLQANLRLRALMWRVSQA